MDASLIRLILIVVGVLLILALYLWERRREKKTVGDGYDEDDDLVEESLYEAPGEALDAPYGVRPDNREPDIGVYDDDEDEDEKKPPRQPSRLLSWLSPRRKVEPSHDDGVDFDSEDVPRENPEPAMDTPAPNPLLIQLSVSARRYPFKGTDLMDVAERCGLYPGEMDIFHCLDEFEDQTRVYFSMANMIKPGTFPFDTIESFSTPGLMLFAQLEGDPEDMTILDEMVATARKLALALNGDVLDDTRRPLTVKKEEEMRQAVLDNEMRWARVMRR
ncbi:cell division protein ZipA [Thiocystis violacea]|uniref:cell division protein ZipA n=1 Tax=Thiocystis violacea TaxID=13725 RepID=UPI00190825C9|nr:cell division protein ZipA [Thiocystis violacea]MBK1716921.1 cell division protein ZipA [Thiocystis violacea]